MEEPHGKARRVLGIAVLLENDLGGVKIIVGEGTQEGFPEDTTILDRIHLAFNEIKAARGGRQSTKSGEPISFTRMRMLVKSMVRNSPFIQFKFLWYSRREQSQVEIRRLPIFKSEVVTKKDNKGRSFQQFNCAAPNGCKKRSGFKGVQRFQTNLDGTKASDRSSTSNLKKHAVKDLG
ncbi:hypothetical protein B0H10DRAFT_2222263 [Mycena sp. CBHHK59/15]|nr:hypothetical protein B0H10DRAFT_2222263 [Mycena sp. CBHHK59/15]